MTVETLVFAILPVSVVILMFTVGLNLRPSSVFQVLRRPRSLLSATVLQVLLLPVAALAVIWCLGPTPLGALALVALAASPGGALSNAFTHLVGGNLGLSVVMTTLTTMSVAATAPVAMVISRESGLLEVATTAQLHPLSIAFDLSRFALLPICAGLLAIALLPGKAARLRRLADIVATTAIATVFVCSLLVSLPVIHEAAAGTLAPALAFSFLSLGIGAAVARALPEEDRSACVIEFGVRNLPIALLLASSGAPSAELVAFLLIYFLVNTAVLGAVAAFGRWRARPAHRGQVARTPRPAADR